MTDTLICPVCRNNVTVTSSRCFSCHLPIRDVRRNQHLTRRHPFKRMLSVLLVATVLVAAAFVWRLSIDDPAGRTDEPSDPRGPGGNEVAHSELQLGQNNGRFDGTIELTNLTDVYADVLITVHVFDENQEVGELHGDLTLKPHSTAVAELSSADEFRSFDDSVVDLFALPASVD